MISRIHAHLKIHSKMPIVTKGMPGWAVALLAQQQRRVNRMKDIKNVRKFEYRECRTPAGFITEYISQGETLHGLCTDVSEAGIRAHFGGSVITGSSGLLILRHPKGVLRVEARVAYVKNNQAGLVFVFQNPWEYGMTIEFIAAITKPVLASKVTPLT